MVLFQVQPLLCSLSSGCPLPVGLVPVGRLVVVVGVPLGRCVGVSGFFPLCAVHRVCRAGAVCLWCPSFASIAGVVVVLGVAPRYVAVVRVLGAILLAVQARGTLACRGACGSVCGEGAIVGAL